MAKLQPWVRYEEADNNLGKFTVSPLERGMGTTLGNALRRVLLSSLSGYAVTSVFIEGVKHEFSAVPYVLEDMFDIIGNVKGIVFKSDRTEPIALEIDLSKKGKVVASSISLPDGVEILNGDAHIAQVSEPSKQKMRIVLERGIGYQTSESNRHAQQPVDSIVLDSSFSPVLKVNHQVKNMRVGKELDYDSLTLDVWTNGSISPEEAIKLASHILVLKFDLFNSINQKPDSELNSAKEGSDRNANSVAEDALTLAIDDLELSARSSNCLKRAGIKTVSELINKDIADLIQIKNFGKKSADEINVKLKQYGLALQQGVESV